MIKEEKHYFGDLANDEGSSPIVPDVEYDPPTATNGMAGIGDFPDMISNLTQEEQ